jgi:hypothetical protein
MKEKAPQRPPSSPTPFSRRPQYTGNMGESRTPVSLRRPYHVHPQPLRACHPNRRRRCLCSSASSQVAAPVCRSSLPPEREGEGSRHAEGVAAGEEEGGPPHLDPFATGPSSDRPSPATATMDSVAAPLLQSKERGLRRRPRGALHRRRDGGRHSPAPTAVTVEHLETQSVGEKEASASCRVVREIQAGVGKSLLGLRAHRHLNLIVSPRIDHHRGEACGTVVDPPRAARRRIWKEGSPASTRGGRRGQRTAAPPRAGHGCAGAWRGSRGGRSRRFTAPTQAAMDTPP